MIYNSSSSNNNKIKGKEGSKEGRKKKKKHHKGFSLVIQSAEIPNYSRHPKRKLSFFQYQTVTVYFSSPSLVAFLSNAIRYMGCDGAEFLC